MQADLFNLSLSNSFERQAFQRSFFEQKYTLRLDQLLGIGLVMIIFFVLVFAWGVEHGKAVSHRDVIQQTAAQEVQNPAVEAPKAIASPIEEEQSLIMTAAEVPAEVSPAAQTASQVSVPPSAPAVQPGKYTIAHITYVKKDQALREIERIKAKGYAAFIVPSGRYFQVCVNGFESRKNVNDALKSLRMKGIVSADAYIRNMPA